MSTVDISKLRPLDAANRKPGDAVVRLNLDGTVTHGRFIAYVPDAKPEFRAIVATVLPDFAQVDAYTVDGRRWERNEPTIFLPPLDPLDEIDPSPGNIAKLTRRQVGEGWRIPAHSEKPDSRAEFWRGTVHGWVRRNPDPYVSTLTYRVPIDPPAPRMVPLSMADVLGRPVMVRSAMNSRPAFEFPSAIVDGGLCLSCGFRDCDSLQARYEISMDHGVTWQKPEKPEPKAEGGKK